MSRRCLAVGPCPVIARRTPDWHHHLAAAVDTGLTTARARRPIFDMVPASRLRADPCTNHPGAHGEAATGPGACSAGLFAERDRALSQPQGHAHERVDVVGQAD